MGFAFGILSRCLISVPSLFMLGGNRNTVAHRSLRFECGQFFIRANHEGEFRVVLYIHSVNAPRIVSVQPTHSVTIRERADAIDRF